MTVTIRICETIPPFVRRRGSCDVSHMRASGAPEAPLASCPMRLHFERRFADPWAVVRKQGILIVPSHEVPQLCDDCSSFDRGVTLSFRLTPVSTFSSHRTLRYHSCPELPPDSATGLGL